MRADPSRKPATPPPRVQQYTGEGMLDQYFLSTPTGQAKERHYRSYGQMSLVDAKARALANGSTPKEALAICLDAMNVHLVWTVRPTMRADERERRKQ